MDQLSILMMLCLTNSINNVETPPPSFEKHIFQENTEQAMPYRFLKPYAYEEQKTEDPTTYPLVIFLHGAGERGTDNEITLTHILPIFNKEEVLLQHPAFVLVPQCPKEKRWVETDWTLLSHIQPEQPSDPMQSLLLLLDEVEEKYPIDPSRIYVMGLSMGGFGAWDLISRYPSRFAAAVPVCGGADLQVASVLTTMPIWAFHGGKDRLVKPSRTRGMVRAIKEAGGQSIKYTEYRDVGHGSWKPAFQEPELIDWMFNQELSK